MQLKFTLKNKISNYRINKNKKKEQFIKNINI